MRFAIFDKPDFMGNVSRLFEDRENLLVLMLMNSA